MLKILGIETRYLNFQLSDYGFICYSKSIRSLESGSLAVSTSFNPLDGSSCTSVVVKRGSNLFRMSANVI